jgi:hypothetical protein
VKVAELNDQRGYDALPPFHTQNSDSSSAFKDFFNNTLFHTLRRVQLQGLFLIEPLKVDEAPWLRHGWQKLWQIVSFVEKALHDRPTIKLVFRGSVGVEAHAPKYVKCISVVNKSGDLSL